MTRQTKAPAASPGFQATPAPIPEHHVRLYKGATRAATIRGGIPTRPFIIVAAAIMWLSMFNIAMLGLAVIAYPIMALISRNDDRAFWILELWLRTKAFARNKKYWTAVSYTPAPYRRNRAWCRHKES